MLFWLAAAASAAAVPATVPSRSNRDEKPVAAEARATIRIVSGVRLRLGRDEGKLDPADHVPPSRDSIVFADGASRPARLIEFE